MLLFLFFNEAVRNNRVSFQEGVSDPPSISSISRLLRGGSRDPDGKKDYSIDGILGGEFFLNAHSVYSNYRLARKFQIYGIHNIPICRLNIRQFEKLGMWLNIPVYVIIINNFCYINLVASGKWNTKVLQKYPSTMSDFYLRIYKGT